MLAISSLDGCGFFAARCLLLAASTVRLCLILHLLLAAPASLGSCLLMRSEVVYILGNAEIDRAASFAGHIYVIQAQMTTGGLRVACHLLSLQVWLRMCWGAYWMPSSHA